MFDDEGPAMRGGKRRARPRSHGLDIGEGLAPMPGLAAAHWLAVAVSTDCGPYGGTRRAIRRNAAGHTAERGWPCGGTRLAIRRNAAGHTAERGWPCGRTRLVIRRNAAGHTTERGWSYGGTWLAIRQNVAGIRQNVAGHAAECRQLMCSCHGEMSEIRTQKQQNSRSKSSGG